jgi:hypothetical protein
MPYEMVGKVKLLFDTMSFPSGFTKREFVVTSDDRYPQDIKFECVKERITMLDNISAGDNVTVSFDLRGNEYNEKYYVNLVAWKIESSGGGSGEAATSEVNGEEVPLPDEANAPADQDDVPF